MKSLRKAAAEGCPCGSGIVYTQCCGQLHAEFERCGQCLASTPEALMRSRYSAYIQRLDAYLLATWHPSTRPQTLDLASDDSHWIGLEVRAANSRKTDSTAASETKAASGTVEFIARYKINGRAFRLHETSRFTREDGQWFYVDGDLHN